MLTLALAQRRSEELLVGFPPRVATAYLKYTEQGDLDCLDVAVLGVLHFYLAKKTDGPLDALPGTTRLADDLGCDSLTMMDTIFTVESLLEIKIDDTALAGLATLDQLRAYIRHQVRGGAVPAT